MAATSVDTRLSCLRKDEEVAALKVENAMLHLRIAQMESEYRELLTRNQALRKHFAQEAGHKQLLLKGMEKFKQEIKHMTEQLTSAVVFLQSVPARLYGEMRKILTEFHDSAKLGQSHHHQQMLQERIAFQDHIAGKERDLQGLRQKYEVEKTRRKALHNALVEVRGNIRVNCRIRPCLAMDAPSGISKGPGQVAVYADDEETVCVVTRKASVAGPMVSNKLFEFDRVFSPENTQEDVFTELRPLIISLLDGYNVCIMAYGQTGSGKTHTMVGRNGGLDTGHQDGVIPLAAEQIFSLIQQNEEELQATYTVEVTVAEIYMERVKDLLDIHSTTKHNVSLTSEKEYDVTTLTSRSAYCPLDVIHLVQEGIQKRAEAATNIHQHSSRSHLVVTVTVTGTIPPPKPLPTSYSGTLPFASPPSSAASSRDITPPGSPLRSSTHFPSTSTPIKAEGGSKIPRIIHDHAHSSKKLRLHSSTPNLFTPPTQEPPEPQIYRSKLQLVDLAGSECVGISGATGTALREAQCINKSLSALSDVLMSLAQHKPHIPYRNSTLTHLLQNSIGGDAKLLIVLCISPTQSHAAESQRCLQFGSRARQIQKGPAKTKLISKQSSGVSK